MSLFGKDDDDAPIMENGMFGQRGSPCREPRRWFIVETSATPCPGCAADSQPVGSAPRQCAFSGQTFRSDNWNCATMNALRDIAGAPGQTVAEAWGVKVALLDVDHVGLPGDPDFLDLGWYKDRGATGLARLESHEGLSRPITLDDALAIIAAGAAAGAELSPGMWRHRGRCTGTAPWYADRGDFIVGDEQWGVEISEAGITIASNGGAGSCAFDMSPGEWQALADECAAQAARAAAEQGEDGGGR